MTKTLLSPPFSGKTTDLSEDLLQGVADLFSVISFQKYCSLVVEHSPIFFIFFHKFQINGYCLVLRNIRLPLGDKWMKFQRGKLEMVFINTI